jgi:hypothetical protein
LAALEADSKSSTARRARTSIRAAGRWPRSRTRTGHHHRRRLPFLLDRQAQVHRRRHARPRAIHAQHGDRRLDRRSRHHPDRCAQGRADPDAAPLYLVQLIGIRHVVFAVNKMDLVGYSRETFRRDRRGLRALRQADRPQATSPRFRSRPHRRQHHQQERQRCPGTTARR